ncbi:MAG: DNA repair protein RecN [Kiritimatiellia bacterium]
MLSRLSVKNLAVVESASITFGSGLNVITGETGAGKSVLMGALHLILGERADRNLIRTDETEATVTAIYEFQDTQEVNALLREADIPLCEGSELILRRTFTLSGQNRIRINDTAATSALLRRLAPLLTDIHGPNDQLSLLDAEFQLTLLTHYAEAQAARAAYDICWTNLKKAEARLLALMGDPDTRLAEIEKLTYEVEEITAINPTEDDGDDLIARHTAIANAGEILAVGNALIDRFSDGENSLSEQLMEFRRTLRDLARILPEASDWGNDLSGIQMQLQELSKSISLRLSQMDASPDTLEQLETRMSQIQRLRRKYGSTISDVIAYGKNAKARLETLHAAGGDIFRVKQEIVAAQRALTVAGESLSAQRKEAIPRLSAAITAELRGLGFAQSHFPIRCDPCAATASGCDAVTFCFEPNPGEAARPLAEIASSGEIARVMLAVRSILARHGAIPTLVFDEIDANIGGETGRKVGEKLHLLGQDVQVLCITHQPQCAVFGDQHFRVHKEVENGRTVTHISELREAERIDEIARMLGGADQTPVTVRHAQEMLAAAHTKHRYEPPAPFNETLPL